MLIPVHLGTHWILAVISMKTQCVLVYDSLMGSYGEADMYIGESLVQYEDKKKSKLDPTQWKIGVEQIANSNRITQIVEYSYLQMPGVS